MIFTSTLVTISKLYPNRTNKVILDSSATLNNIIILISDIPTGAKRPV